MKPLQATSGLAEIRGIQHLASHPYALKSIPKPPPTPSARPPFGHLPEPLVDLGESLAVFPAYDGSDGIQGHYPPLLRESAAARLLQAQENLPAPLRLAVLDAWRPVAFQTALVHHYGQTAASGGFVTITTDPGLVPPHVSGGAVDLTLDAGSGPLAIGSGFDEFSERAHLRSLEGPKPNLDGVLRRILFWSMVEAGFAPYQLEWWHFSFGDQNWAAYYGLESSLYAAATLP